MNKIILSRMCPDSIDQECMLMVGHLACDGTVCDNYNALRNDCETGAIVSRTMTDTEQQEHHRHIIGRASQSKTAPRGFADNSLFFKTVVYEAHTFTSKDGVKWNVSLNP